MHDLIRCHRFSSRVRVVLVLCCLFVHPICQDTDAKDIRVGGDVGWSQTEIDDIEAFVGDRLVGSYDSVFNSRCMRLPMTPIDLGRPQVFDWEGVQRNVVTLPRRNCSNVHNGVQIANPKDSPAVIGLNYTGTFYFASSLSDQCASGSLFAVSVIPEKATPGKPNTTRACVLQCRHALHACVDAALYIKDVMKWCSCWYQGFIKVFFTKVFSSQAYVSFTTLSFPVHVISNSQYAHNA